MEQAPSERRWRALADGVAASLGLNVWVSVVLLPALFIGKTGGNDLLLGLIPLLVLGLGLWRRSEAVLLLAYPAAVLVPIAVHPVMASAHVYGPIRFVTVAIGVTAYLVGVSFFTNFHEPTPPVSIRPLSSALAGPPQRWRRRERVYWELFALSLIMPVSLLLWVNYAPEVQGYLGENYPGRVAAMTTVLVVGVIALWLVIFHVAFLGVLRPHRTGDRDLLTTLAQAKADARTGRPRTPFYVGVVAALAGMLVLLLLRHL